MPTPHQGTWWALWGPLSRRSRFFGPSPPAQNPARGELGITELFPRQVRTPRLPLLPEEPGKAGRRAGRGIPGALAEILSDTTALPPRPQPRIVINILINI